MRHDQFRLFSEEPIRELYEERSESIKDTIYDENEGTILNANKIDYVDWIFDKHQIQKPIIDTDKETMVREERTRDRTQKQEYVLCYPVAGNTDLLQYQPSNKRITRNSFTKVEN